MESVPVLVCALGIAQIISWGTLFYAVSVLGPPMAHDLGVSQAYVFGAFTAALIVSGILSPWIGRLVDRKGGRVVLSFGSLTACISLLVLAAAPSPGIMTAGWLLSGAAMAATLYDPAFATLAQHTGAMYRRSVTALTIFGALASTLSWPLCHLLLAGSSWRGAFYAFAVVHLVLCLPLHLAAVPKRFRIMNVEGSLAASAPPRVDKPVSILVFLGVAFAAASFASAAMAVHAITLLVSAGMTQAQAIAFGMLFGPMQVAGRIGELAFARRITVELIGWIAFGLLMVAIAALIGTHGPGFMPLLFAVAFGAGNGIFTIIRGTVPAVLLGKERLGATLGQLASVSLFARALAPACLSWMLAIGYSRTAALVVLGLVLVVAVTFYSLAIRQAHKLAASSAAPAREPV